MVVNLDLDPNVISLKIIFLITRPVMLYSREFLDSPPSGSSSRAVLDGEISKRCVVCALDGSLYNIVNHLFTGTTDKIL